uniref:Uncharacterized protein n=1 Tax=Leersia perrieri TaxID=77586 RepID=A0A0D9VBP3_9ORYZ
MDSNMLTHGRSNRPSTQESSTYSEAATYAAYMVFKLATGSTGMDHPHRAKIRFGGYKASHQVFLQIHGNKSATQNKQLVDHNEDELVPNSHSLSGTSTITRRRTGNHKAQIDEIKPGLDQIDPPCHGGNAYYPDKRADGWMEIQLGEFYSDDGEDDEVFISLVASEGDEMKRGLFVQGIEIRFQKWRTSPNARHHEKS